MAQNLMRSETLPSSGQAVPARIWFPYRSGFNRTIRLIGMASLLGSSLGLLAAVAGLPLNFPTMVGVIMISIGLIGYSVRPSLRKPKF